MLNSPPNRMAVPITRKQGRPTQDEVAKRPAPEFPDMQIDASGPLPRITFSRMPCCGRSGEPSLPKAVPGQPGKFYAQCSSCGCRLKVSKFSIERI